jgi:hypothetical protein
MLKRLSILLSLAVAPLCALPVDCADVSTVEDLLNANPLGGCRMEQLIFSSFTYTGDVLPRRVIAVAQASEGEAENTYGFYFAPKATYKWRRNFTLGYALTLLPTTPDASIRSSLEQANFGTGAQNAASLISTKTPAGAVHPVNRTHATDVRSFDRTLELTSRTEVFIPTGGLVASIQEDYTISTPEPSHLLAAGMFLAALLARRRFRARSGD